MNDEPVYITEKGVKLYLNKTARLFNDMIKKRGLKNVQVFLAILPDNYKEYVIVKDGQPFYKSQRGVDIEGQIEMMTIANRYR